MAAKISISLTDPTLVTWAQRKSKREGKSVSAIFTELAERQRRLEAMDDYLAWAGADALPPRVATDAAAELDEALREARRAKRPKRARSPKRR